MQSQFKITAFIYILAGVLALTSAYLGQLKIDGNVIKPLGSSFSVLSAISKRERPDYVVYGYLPYWMMDTTKYLQLDKLTDIAYFALRIDEDGSIRKLDEEGNIEPGYNQWRNNTELDELIRDSKAQGVRFALTIISHEDDITKKFLDCRTCWDKLLAEIITEMQHKKIVDLNMDFELVEADAEEGLGLKYSQLVNFLNKGLDAKFGNSYVVTATLPDSVYRPRITEIESLARASDALFIMAYDFHRPTSDTAGPVAPINGAGIHAEYDIKTMLDDYLKKTTANKLLLGVPYYGYNWLVTDQDDRAERIPGDDVLGYSMSQSYTNITELRLKYNPEIKWDEHGLVPHFTYIDSEKGTARQVYFENKDSLKVKYDLAKDSGLAGVGIWALGYDGGYQELWDLLKEEFVGQN